MQAFGCSQSLGLSVQVAATEQAEAQAVSTGCFFRALCKEGLPKRYAVSGFLGSYWDNTKENGNFCLGLRV